MFYWRLAIVATVLFSNATYSQGDISWGNRFFQLKIDRKTGNLLEINAENKLLVAGDGTPSADVEIDGRWMLGSGHPLYAGHEIARDTLRLHQKLEGQPDTVTTTYILGKAGLERAVTFHGHSAGERKFTGFLFRSPGFCAADRNNRFATVPGPFWPATFTPPGTPYDSLRHKTIRYHSAPDAGFGIFILDNPFEHSTATTFIKTNGEVHYNTVVMGNDSLISIEQKNNYAYYLREGDQLSSDTQCILITRSPAQGIAAYRRIAAGRMPLASATPAWVKEAVILEVLPDYFKDGFRGITRKLPFYKDIGFNTIYLMPHWMGGYSPVDLYQVNPKYGSREDLQQLVRTAHNLGMKVLFDMVIHGFNTSSPVIKEHPSFFYRDGRDSLMIHPAWGSAMTDFMDPSYRRYMEDYVLHEQQTFGNDGYRIDAASYKGPNWNTHVNYPAYKSGSTSPALIKIILDALRKNDTAAALLSEVFGPVFYTVSNFAHDNQTEAMSFLIKEIEKGNYTIAQYKEHVANVYSSLPADAVRVFFARNHDTSWFYEFFGYSPLFMSIEAIHALFGVPEVFAGDPNYSFNPEDDPAIFAKYKKLFAARKAFPEFIHGEKNFDAVSCNNDAVFTGLAKDQRHASVAVISTSPRKEKVIVSINSSVAKKKLNITLKPYEMKIIRIY